MMLVDHALYDPGYEDSDLLSLDMIRRRRHDSTEERKKEKRNKGCYSLLLHKNTERVHQISKRIFETPKGRVYAKRKMGTRLRVKGIYLNRRRQPENGDLP
nr:hypothetical protein [Tanacetum cinerariifolium]